MEAIFFLMAVEWLFWGGSEWYSLRKEVEERQSPFSYHLDINWEV